MAQPNINDAHILIVDDDERIRGLLQKFLARNGFWVTTARDAAHARRLLKGLEFDLLVLDVMMPNEDGITLTKSLRETLNTPILLLTAKAETGERIMGLEAGADDYLTKPFEPKELVLRINAILRRVPVETPIDIPPKTLQLGDVHYDVSRGEIWRGTELIRLTATESALMRIFSSAIHQSVSRSKLVEDLGRDTGQSQERAVDVQITGLRKKLGGYANLIETVRGVGYRFKE